MQAYGSAHHVGGTESVPLTTIAVPLAGQGFVTCPRCDLRTRPSAFHLCLDLAAPEPVVAPKPKPAPKPKAKKRRKAPAPAVRSICACGAPISKAGSRQCRSCWELALKPECGTPEGYQWHYRRAKKDPAAQWPLPADDPCGCRAAWGRRRGPRYESLDPLAPGAIAMYEAGDSMRKIATELGVSAMGISRLLKRNGVTMRAPGSQPGRPRPTTRALTPEQEANVVTTYREGGVTYVSLAAQYGVTKSVIRAAIRRANDAIEETL